MMTEELVLSWIFPIYIFFLVLFLVLLSPPVRRVFKIVEEERVNGNKENIGSRYEKHLHILVITRYFLLFLFPLVFSIIILGIKFASDQLLTLIVMGGSIVAFLIVELPLLMKAHIRVTFTAKVAKEVQADQQVYNQKYSEKISFEVGKATLVTVAIYNLGFSTYKNARVLIYFGKDFDITPYTEDKFSYRYKDLDFQKPFTVQKKHGGVAFVPSDTVFLTIPPQEVVIFPVFLTLLKNIPEKEANITVQFSSEDSWGMTTIVTPFKIVKEKTS